MHAAVTAGGPCCARCEAKDVTKTKTVFGEVSPPTRLFVHPSPLPPLRERLEATVYTRTPRNLSRITCYMNQKTRDLITHNLTTIIIIIIIIIMIIVKNKRFMQSRMSSVRTAWYRNIRRLLCMDLVALIGNTVSFFRPKRFVNDTIDPYPYAST